MKDHKASSRAASVLLFASMALAGCGDDITNVLDDLETPDGSDRVAGGSFSTGTWKAAGTNADGNPFRACLNVSVDGNSLTKVGSSCTDNANTFSIDVDGSTDCNFYYDLDVPIANDGTFEVLNFNPDERAPILSMRGSYSNGDASGTITVDQSQWGGGVCNAKWVAYAPGNTSTDDIVAPDPDTNTGAAVTAGLWIDTGFNSDGEDQHSCFFVNTAGTHLTHVGSSCDDRQGSNPGNAFNVQIERGSNDCYLYLDDQDASISVPIVNGRIALNNYQPSEYAPALSFEGTFTSATTASGTIKIDSPYPNGDCTAKWNVTKQ